MGVLLGVAVAVGAVLSLIQPVWGFCVYVATVIIRPNEQFDDVFLPALPLMIVAISASYVLHLGSTLPRPPGRRSLATPLMLLMMALLGLHLLLDRPRELVDWVLNDLAQVVLFLFFLTQLLSTPRRLQAYLTTVSLSSCVVAGIPFFVHFFYRGARRLVPGLWGSLVESYGPLWDSYHAEGRLIGKARGMWANSNDLGMVANWAVPGALYYVRRRGSALLKLFWTAALGMLATVLILTGSRGSQLQLGVTLWMFFVGGRRRLLGLVLLGLAMTGILVLLPHFSPERSDTVASANERTALLLTGVSMFLRHPVWGVGFNSFSEHSFHRLVAHNVYMQCLAETGLVGAAIFFPLVFFLRRETSRAVKYFDGAEDPSAAALARAIGALQLSFSVFILFSNQFMRFTFAVPMAAGIALFLTARREQARQRPLFEEESSSLASGGTASP